MKKLIILTALYLLASATAPRAEGTPVDVPVNVSWIPGMGMGESRGDYRTLRSNVSLNVLAGRGGNLAGVEFGGIWNHEANGAAGLQAGGIGNSVGGNIRACQLAGIANLVTGSCRGAQLAGIGNLAAAGATGLQAAGIMNDTHGTLNGIQLAGILNRAGHVASGMQIGLVNASESNDGYPVGLVSYVKKEGLHVDVWTDETGFVNTGLRSGTAAFHNIVFAGYRNGAGPAFRTAGTGLGFHRELGLGAFVECDLLGQYYSRYGTDADAGVMSRMRLLAGYRFRSGASVYAGPVQTSCFTDRDSEVAPAPWGESPRKAGIDRTGSWFGMAAGVRY